MKSAWISLFVIFAAISGWAQERDAWDPQDDSVGGATDLGIPTSTLMTHGIHTLSSVDPEDWFQFSVVEGEIYEFYSTGELDTIGELIAADGTTVLQISDDDERGLNFRVVYQADVSGIIFVRVFTSTLDTSGEYILNYTGTGSGTGGDEWDPVDDVFTGATDLGTPTTEPASHGPHSLALNDQADWFTLFLIQGVTYQFESMGSGDVVADLYQPGGIFRLASDNDSGEDNHFRLIYTAPADGVYLLRVTLKDPEGRADYTLVTQAGVDPLPEGDEWDPEDNIFENATALAITTEEQTHGPHTLSPSDIHDWFLLTLESGNTYTLFSSGGDGLVADLFFDDGVTRVIDEDVVGEEPDFMIEYTPNDSGKYYLRVGQRSREDATYTVHYVQSGSLPEPVLDAFDPQDDTPAGASALSAPEPFEQILSQRTLSLGDLVDWYTVQVEAGVTYEFWSTGLSDTVAALFAEDSSTELLQDDDNGSERNFSLTYTPEASTTLFLSVRSFNAGAEAAYRLHYRTLSDSSSVVDVWEPDNTLETANSLGATPTFEQVHGPHVLSSADGNDLEDWYIVFLLEGETYEFFSDGSGDLIAELYTGDGTAQITTDDDGGEGTNFLITITAPRTDFYAIRVREVTQSESVYDLHYRGFSETLPPTLEAAQTWSLNTLDGVEIIPGGFEALPAGDVIAGEVQEDVFSDGDGLGLSLIVDEGEVATILLPETPITGTALIRALIRRSSPEADVVLAGITSDTNPALATQLPNQNAIVSDGYRWHTFVQTANGSPVSPLLQAAATGTETVQVDIETVEIYSLDDSTSIVPASLFLSSQFSPAFAPNTTRPLFSLGLGSPADYVEIPGGFESLAPAAVSVSTIPDETDQSDDDTGIIFVAAPDQVTLLQFSTFIDVNQTSVLARARVRMDGDDGTVTLASFDSTLSGIATASTNGTLAPDGEYIWLPLHVVRGADQAILVLQVSNLGGSDTVTVYIDTIEVFTLPGEGFIPVHYLLLN